MMRSLTRAVFFAICLLAACRDASGPDSDARSVPPSPEAASYLRGALRMAQQGEIEGAKEAVERARRTSPDAPDVYLIEGQILLAARDFAGAASALEHAARLRPDDARTWEMLGHAAFQQRGFRTAIAHYRRAAAIEETPFVWQGIGTAYRELYEPDSAVKAFEHVLSLDSTFAPAWADLAEIEEDAGDFAKALHHAERASIASPRTAAYQYLRARLLVEIGRSDDAIPLLEELVHRNPTDHSSLYTLGLAYRNVGNEAMAESTLVRAARARSTAAQAKQL